MDHSLKVFHLDKIESTSLYAKQIAKHEDHPFLVVAFEQTAGYGRRKSKWVSPFGGLYMTLALGPRLFSVHDFHSLGCAVWLAEWISQTWGLHSTVKWPNDLFLAGGKLAGILVETQLNIQAERKAPMIAFDQVYLGVGLNLYENPPNQAYKTTCLKDLARLPHLDEAGKKNFISEKAQSLSRFFMNKCAELDQQTNHPNFLGYRLYKPQEGSFLKSGSKLYQFMDWGSERELVVKSTDRLPAVVSIDDAGMGMTPVKISGDTLGSQELVSVLVDVGNSTIKLKIGPSGPILRTTQDNVGSVLRQMQADAAGKKVFLFWILSSSPTSMASLVSELNNLRVSFCIIKNRLVYLKRSHYDLEQLGVDRLAAMEWVIYQSLLSSCESEALFDFVLISAGTATTIDVVVDRCHKGGWILPGYKYTQEFYRKKIPHLDVDAGREASSASHSYRAPLNTSDACQESWFFGLEAFVREIIIRENLGPRTQIYLTGGVFAQEAVLNQFKQFIKALDLNCTFTADAALSGVEVLGGL